MELKVNMYVRLKQGYIGRIININEFRELKYCVDIQASDYVFVDEEDIIKSSPNIIDLIECDDYILTEDYDLFRKVGLTDEDELMLETYIEDNVVMLVPITKILKICTKDNFERVSYDVKNN